jgi:molybdopterin molybdotransferase
VAADEIVVERGLMVTPARAGLLAAAGLAGVRVHRRPSVGVLATGDEVVLPGEPLKPGQLYASNIVTLFGWLRRFGMAAEAARRPDNAPTIREAAAVLLDRHDALLTSGGAWKSERDLTVRIMEDLGGELLYERVRIGPGKAVALAVVGGKPVFCLPGGPASNEMAFLQLALPGLLRLAGLSPEPFERRSARLDAAVEGTPEWTQFFQATLAEDGGGFVARPLRGPSRLRAQALAEAIITLPQGCRRLDAGRQTQVQVLHPGTARQPAPRPDIASPESTSR